MAQHDYDIANQSGANFRADLNNALDAIVSNNSGTSEPSTTFAYEWWVDTTNNLLKLRNSANNAWITLPLSITADNSTSGALTVNGNLTTTGTIDVNGQELILDADADTSITADTDDQIDIKIGGTDVATLTDSNLVLKGSGPTLTIGDGGAEDTKIIFDGNAQDYYLGLDDSADKLVIGNGSTVGLNVRFLLDSSGNIEIGGSSPSPSALTVKLATDKHIGFNPSQSELGSVPAIVAFQDNGALAEIGFRGTDIRFATSASERMRIDSSGNVLVGQTSLNYNAVGASIANNGLIRAASEGQVTAFNRKGSDGVITTFYKDGVSVGSISTNNNSLPSDRNFKRDISDLNLGLDLVTKLKPSQYNYKVSDEGSPKIYGLIAQDLEESLTEVGVEKNSTWLLQHNPKEDVNESDYSLDYTKLIPILINSIKELEARIKTLEE